MAQRTIITWSLFTVTSDFLPFLIKVHKLGHVIAQGHSAHSTGRVRLSIQKQHWHWEMEQVATIYLTCKCTTSKVKLYKIWKQWIFQSTHVKWDFIASSVAVFGTEHTNKVFLVYKEKDKMTDQSGTRNNEHLLNTIKHCYLVLRDRCNPI